MYVRKTHFDKFYEFKIYKNKTGQVYIKFWLFQYLKRLHHIYGSSFLFQCKNILGFLTMGTHYTDNIWVWQNAALPTIN